jgi:hypothetical protein
VLPYGDSNHSKPLCIPAFPSGHPNPMQSAYYQD